MSLVGMKLRSYGSGVYLISNIGRHGVMIEARIVREEKRVWRNVSISLFSD